MISALPALPGREPRERLAQPELLARWEPPAPLVHRVPKDLRAFRELPVQPGQLVLRGRQEPRERLAQPELLARWERLAPPELPVQQAPPEQLVPLAPPALQGRHRH